MRWLMTLLMLAAAAWPTARANASDAELDGTVTLSPARPGPQHAGERGAIPMANAVVRALQANGTEVARTTSDDQGHFKMAVAPGAYEIAVDASGAAFPRCQATHVVVHDGERTDVQVTCDSGMR